MQGDQFDWTINQGRTSSQNTGPQADHSLGTPKGNFGQKYLYFAFHLEYLWKIGKTNKAVMASQKPRKKHRQAVIHFFFFPRNSENSLAIGINWYISHQSHDIIELINV